MLKCAYNLLQVLSNMIDYGMEPQAALNAPRFLIEGVDSAYGPACVEHSQYVSPDCSMSCAALTKVYIGWIAISTVAVCCS